MHTLVPTARGATAYRTQCIRHTRIEHPSVSYVTPPPVSLYLVLRSIRPRLRTMQLPVPPIPTILRRPRPTLLILQVRQGLGWVHVPFYLPVNRISSRLLVGCWARPTVLWMRTPGGMAVVVIPLVRSCGENAAPCSRQETLFPSWLSSR